MIKTCMPDEVVVLEKRQRTNYDGVKLKELQTSIAKMGQMQPGVCRIDDGKLVLIAGWRRLQACKNLNIPYTYILKDEINDPILLEEMELHENLMRENLSFKDEAEARTRLHQLYMSTRGTSTVKGQPTWSIEKTAIELGISKATLFDDIEISEFAKAIPAVADAKNKTDAKKVIKKLKGQVIQNEVLKSLSSQTPPPPNSNDLDQLKYQLAGAINQFKEHLMLGNFDSLAPTLEPESFNVVFFDPPWGVELQDVYLSNASQHTYRDSRKDFFKNFRKRLHLIYDLMAPNAHLYIKFAITSHYWVVRSLIKTGFMTDGVPLIWYKKNQHYTRSPERYFGRCYEPILLAHKGSKPLQLQGRPAFIETPLPNSKMKGIHPSVIHPKVLIDLFERSCFPGDRILDPMAGSGMTGVACEKLRTKLQLDYLLIEQEEPFYNLILENLLKGYDNLVNNNESELDYKSVEPGSPEWIKIWTDNPDLQPEMKQYLEEKNGPSRN